MWAWIYVEIDERSSGSILRKMISVLQTGIEPATSWRPERRSNHWATRTQMAREGVSSRYTCDLSGTHYILIIIDAILDLEMWAWIYIEIDERSASSILRKTIFVVRSPSGAQKSSFWVWSLMIVHLPQHISKLTFLNLKLHQSLSIYSGFHLGRTYMSNYHFSSPSESW